MSGNPADPRPVTGTDTEYLGDREGLKTSPITHHNVAPVSGEGAGGPGQPPPPSDPEALRPLRTYTMSPMGWPLQVWVGVALILAIAAVMFL